MSSKKGSKWERDVAKFLTKWLTGVEKPYCFWRSPGSGSVSTIIKENEHISGDIISLKPEAKFFTDVFSIELKTGYPDTSFFHYFSCKNFQIENFWSQCVKDAGNKNPLLVYKKDRNTPIVGITKIVANKLKLNKLKHITVKFDKLPDLVLLSFYDFFNKVKPEDIKKWPV
ncbi:MAG: putative PDDEXK endonuclease [Atribacterota bacterium]